LTSRAKPHKPDEAAASLEWKPGETWYVPPTLIVLHSTDVQGMADLRRDVEQRLRPYVEIGALQWLEWFDPEEEVSSEKITQACEPLLRLDLWQRLVKAGYRPQLPDARSPAQVQIFVVWDAMTQASQDPVRGLKQFAESTKQQLKGKAELSLALVLLGGEPGVEVGALDAYWPRVRLSTTALGGTRVERGRVHQTCQHILVALVSSELTRTIESVMDKSRESAGWIALGASALLVDLPLMRQGLRQAILKEVLKPLVASPLTDLERQGVEEMIEGRATAFREAMLGEATIGLKESGWRLDREGLAIKQCCLANPDLLDAAFGEYRGGVPMCVPSSSEEGRRSLIGRVRGWSFRDARMLLSVLAEPFLPARNLSEELAEHYSQLRAPIEFRPSLEKAQGIAPTVRREYEDLRKLFASFLDRGLVPSEGIPSLRGVSTPMPAGLQAAIQAVASMLKYLANDRDVQVARDARVEWVRPAPLDSDRYWEAAAEADADLVEGNLRRYSRFARTLASPLGVALRLIPAWPLLTGLLSLLPDWDVGRSAIVAGAALVVIGIAELVYWWLIRAWRLLNRIQGEAHRCLADRVLTLTTRAIRDCRLLVMIRLRKAFFVLKDLHTLLLERYRTLEEAQRFLTGIRSVEEGSVYRLVDWKPVLEWARMAAEDINRSGWSHELHELQEQLRKRDLGYDSAITALIAKEVWPLAVRPAPIQAIVRRFEEESDNQAERIFKPDRLEPTPIVKNIVQELESLKEGRQWEWLWQHAQPLGEAGPSHSTLTVILAPERALKGDTGWTSPYWRSEWLEARTRQTHEVVCIRGMIEWK